MNQKWFDARVNKPECNGSSIYKVILLYFDHVIEGYAIWVPFEPYVDGKWEKCRANNGNKWDNATVLYWHPHPPFPEGISL